MATKREWDRVINHWTRIATGTRRKNEYIGGADCAFCNRYFNKGCNGCPIKIKTSLKWCEGTPYDDIIDYYDNYHGDKDDIYKKKDFMRLAETELDFLKKLRKEVRGD